MHQAFHAGQQFHEGTEGSDAHDLVFHHGTGGQTVSGLQPGIAFSLLAGQGDAGAALVVLADGQQLGAHHVAHGHSFVSAVHAGPGEFGKMDHAFHTGGQFHEGTKGGQTGDAAFHGIAHIEGSQDLFQVFLTFAIQQGAAGNHDVAAAVFHTDDEELHGAAHQSFGVSHAHAVHLAAGTEGILAHHADSVTALAGTGHAAIHGHTGVAGVFQGGHTGATHGAGQTDLTSGGTHNIDFDAVTGGNAFVAFGIEDVLAVHDTIQLDAHIHKDRVTGDGDDGARHFLTRLQAHSAGFLGREHGGEVFAAFFEGGQILFVSHGIFAP